MASVRQRESHDRLARLEQSEVHGEVGGRSGVRLDVGVLDAEKFFRAVDCEVFYLIDVALALVVAAAGIAFGVFVLQDRTARFEHRFRRVIFRWDKADGIDFVSLFRLYQIVNLGISSPEFVHRCFS